METIFKELLDKTNISLILEKSDRKERLTIDEMRKVKEYLKRRDEETFQENQPCFACCCCGRRIVTMRYFPKCEDC